MLQESLRLSGKILSENPCYIDLERQIKLTGPGPIRTTKKATVEEKVAS